MPKSTVAITEHFKHRASAYRRLASQAHDDQASSNMLELAVAFEQLSAELQAVEFTSTQTQTIPKSARWCEIDRRLDGEESAHHEDIPGVIPLAERAQLYDDGCRRACFPGAYWEAALTHRDTRV